MVQPSRIYDDVTRTRPLRRPRQGTLVARVALHFPRRPVDPGDRQRHADPVVRLCLGFHRRLVDLADPNGNHTGNTLIACL